MSTALLSMQGNLMENKTILNTVVKIIFSTAYQTKKKRSFNLPGRVSLQYEQADVV